jgi:hypothetical protein
MAARGRREVKESPKMAHIRAVGRFYGEFWQLVIEPIRRRRKPILARLFMFYDGRPAGGK